MSLRASRGIGYLIGSIVAATAIGPTPVRSQDFPTKPITLVNANAAGGVSDKMARVMARAMEKSLGKPILIESKPGGSSVVGVAYVIKQAPDGYTLGHTCSGPVVLELMGEKLPFDMSRDLITIGSTGALDTVLVARPDLGVNTIEELIALAKKRPGLNVGMVQAPANIIPIAYLAKKEGIDLNMVFYKGEAQAGVDLLGGNIDLSVNSPGFALQHIQKGTMKPLLLLSQVRNPVLPDVPAVVDNRTKGGFSAQTGCLIFAPAGTPRPIIEKINKAMSDAAQDPEVLQVYKQDGLVAPKAQTVEEAATTIPDLRKTWTVARDVIDLSKYK